MTSCPRLRALASLLLLAALPACGTAQPDAAAPAEPRASFDQALHARLPADVRDSGVVRVATDATYPPASSYGEDGRTIVGFEPDLAAALGRVLGVSFEFVVTDFVDTLPALQQGTADMVMSAMTDTVERQARADFVDYFSAGTSIIVQRGNPHGISDLRSLCGKEIAAEQATVQVDLLERAQRSCPAAPIVVRQFPNNASALVELRTGRGAAVLNDYPPAAELTTHPRTSADFQLASTVQYEPGLYGMAIGKDDPALRDALQEALSRLVRSGEYADVLARWDVSSGAISRVSINGGSST